MTVIFWQIEDASVDTQHGIMLITNLFFWIVYNLLCAIYCCNVNPILRKYKYSLRKGCRARIPHLLMWNGVYVVDLGGT